MTSIVILVVITVAFLNRHQIPDQLTGWHIEFLDQSSMAEKEECQSRQRLAICCHVKLEHIKVPREGCDEQLLHLDLPANRMKKN